jgi:hypothetical protein
MVLDGPMRSDHGQDRLRPEPSPVPVRDLVTLLACHLAGLPRANLFRHSPPLLQMAPVQLGCHRCRAIEMIAELLALIGFPGAALFRCGLCPQHTLSFAPPRRLIPLEPDDLALVGRGHQPRMGLRAKARLQAVDRNQRPVGGFQHVHDRGTHPPRMGMRAARHLIDSRFGYGGPHHRAHRPALGIG